MKTASNSLSLRAKRLAGNEALAFVCLSGNETEQPMPGTAAKLQAFHFKYP